MLPMQMSRTLTDSLMFLGLSFIIRVASLSLLKNDADAFYQLCMT